MSGVDARHMGIEVNFIYIPVKWFELEGMLSLGDYEWASNAVGYFYDQNGFPLANLNGSLASGVLADDHLKATLEQKGVKVGGTAQTTGSLSATFRPFKGWRIGADWIMNANNYSDYQVKDSNINPGSDISVAKTVAHTMGQPAGPFGKLQLQDRRDRRTPDRQCTMCSTTTMWWTHGPIPGNAAHGTTPSGCSTASAARIQ